jgi:flavin-dependent dehydrogenase
VLDRLLAEAAVKAGAELRDRFTVEELVFDGERVVGIRGSDAAGTTVTERSRLVVGADGPNSLVARLAAAPEYDVHPPIDSACWSYWSGPALDEAVEFYPREYRCCWGWRTGDGLALVGANWPIDEFHVLGRDPEAEFLAVVEAAAPDLAAGLREGRRAERWHRGFLRNFFRRPFGPGWALVGDAGYTKTAFTAEGITDAFHDAERVATAIDAGLSGTTPMKAALAAAEQQRNQAVKPFYDFSRDLAAMHPPTPELAAVFAALVGNQPETDRLCGVFAQLISPAEFFAPDNVGRILQAVGN